MQTMFFVMAILGCGESDAACREVRIEQQTWRSEASCRAATPAALMRHSDLEYPTVVARCRPADARPQLLRGSDVLLPAPRNAVVPRFAARSSR